MRETKTGFGAKAQYQQEGGLQPEDESDEGEDDEDEEGDGIDQDDEEDEESDHNFWYLNAFSRLKCSMHVHYNSLILISIYFTAN